MEDTDKTIQMLRERVISLEWVVAKLIRMAGVPEEVALKWHTEAAEVNHNPSKHLNASLAVVRALDSIEKQ